MNLPSNLYSDYKAERRRSGVLDVEWGEWPQQGYRYSTAVASVNSRYSVIDAVCPPRQRMLLMSVMRDDEPAAV